MLQPCSRRLFPWLRGAAHGACVEHPCDLAAGLQHAKAPLEVNRLVDCTLQAQWPTRSPRGNQFLAQGFRVHETCQRQGVGLWDFTPKDVHAFISNTAPPSLVARAGRPVAAPKARSWAARLDV